MDKINVERIRSLKFVQVVFGVLALASLVCSLIVATRGVELGLPEASTYSIALGFLIVGVLDTALLFLWEHIFETSET